MYMYVMKMSHTVYYHEHRTSFQKIVYTNTYTCISTFQLKLCGSLTLVFQLQCTYVVSVLSEYPKT